MQSKVHNFNAGPSVLPDPVLQQAQEELLDYQGLGMSIMEYPISFLALCHAAGVIFSLLPGCSEK